MKVSTKAVFTGAGVTAVGAVLITLFSLNGPQTAPQIASGRSNVALAWANLYVDEGVCTPGGPKVKVFFQAGEVCGTMHFIGDNPAPTLAPTQVGRARAVALTTAPLSLQKRLFATPRSIVQIFPNGGYGPALPQH